MVSLARKRILDRERYLTATVLLENNILVGTVDEMMRHPTGQSALETLRACVRAIELLVNRRISVSRSNVMSVVNVEIIDGDEPPPLLDQVARFCVDDMRARMFWHGRIRDDQYPHRCPCCDGAGYIGFMSIDCKSSCGGFDG